MFLFAAIQIALRALRANLGRSLLTILGIVIGVLSIVLVVSLGDGAKGLILQEIEGIGANAVILRPGRQPESPVDIGESILSDSIKERDIQALRRKENVPHVLSINPAMLVPGPVTYQDQIFRPTTFGWTGSALTEIFGVSPEFGENFTDDDIRARAKVAVIGAKVKQELFGESEALGQSIKIRDHNIKVIGVLPARGQVSFFNIDELVMVPYSTAQKTLLGVDYYHEIFIRVDDDRNVPQVVADVEATMREMHNITDRAKDDFFVTTQQEALKTISTITQALTIFLVAIASIALVVAGIGIMNIMLVSVTERTQEIGLRKAVGATNADILTQFLLEAVILTLFGGVIGTVLAVGLSWLIAFIIRQQYNLAWPFVFPLGAILLGVSVATGVGLIFGIFPARRAAQKNPIEALRYE